MSKISLEKFINNTKGTQVDVPWAKKSSKLKGQCVSLIQTYIEQCLEQSAKARGNAKDWIQSYVNEGLGYTVSDQKTGDIIVFPNEANGLGHIAIYVDGKLYDQNNLRHDNGLAGFGDIFSWDFVTLRPNSELIIKDEKNVSYLNLHKSVDSWRIYKKESKPVIGNECGFLYPKKFNGLSYIIKGYTLPDVAIIETRDYGEVQIYVKSNYAIISKKPIYNVVN